MVEIALEMLIAIVVIIGLLWALDAVITPISNALGDIKKIREILEMKDDNHD